MKPEVNAVLQEVKANLANPKPTMPNFNGMSIMEATKWCLTEGGISKPMEIAKLTGKQVNTIHTAMWKIRNPKRVKVLARRAKKVKALKAGVVKEGVKEIKVAKPKITNGLYDDGMETPWLDMLQKKSGFVMPRSIEIADKALQNHEYAHELVAENRRLKILVDHYEALLFKGGK
jgi:hypothetical protein